MLFNKEDLQFVHYRWERDEASLNNFFLGEPSRRLFDPHNGKQVLFLVNCYASAIEHFTLRDAHTIESKIAHQLPTDLKSEIAVFNWIKRMMTPGGS